MNIMSNWANKAKAGTIALATMGVVGVGIKNAMRPTPAEEATQAELVENMLSEIKNGSTIYSDSLREAKNKEVEQGLLELDSLGELIEAKNKEVMQEFSNRYSKEIHENYSKLSAAMKAYNLSGDTLLKYLESVESNK